MKLRTIRLGVLAATLSVGGFVLTPAQAQDTPSTQSAAAAQATPHLANGQPDLNGMWRNTSGNGGRKGSIYSVATKQQNGDASLIFSSRRCAPQPEGL